MPGICLNLDKDGSSVDSEIRAIDNINDKDFNGKSGDTVSLSYERYRFGETGIGATVVVSLKLDIFSYLHWNLINPLSAMVGFCKQSFSPDSLI